VIIRRKKKEHNKNNTKNTTAQHSQQHNNNTTTTQQHNNTTTQQHKQHNNTTTQTTPRPCRLALTTTTPLAGQGIDFVKEDDGGGSRSRFAKKIRHRLFRSTDVFVEEFRSCNVYCCWQFIVVGSVYYFWQFIVVGNDCCWQFIDIGNLLLLAMYCCWQCIIFGNDCVWQCWAIFVLIKGSGKKISIGMSVYSLCEVSRRFAIPLTAKKFMPLSVATALAINVLEHPGGPYSSTPLGGRMPMVVNNSGRCNGHSTASFRRAFTNCCPAKERERESVCWQRESFE